MAIVAVVMGFIAVALALHASWRLRQLERELTRATERLTDDLLTLDQGKHIRIVKLSR